MIEESLTPNVNEPTIGADGAEHASLGEEGPGLPATDSGATSSSAEGGTAVESGDEAPEQGAIGGSGAPHTPDDYYVTLQPLTLDLLAHQMERLSVRFARMENHLTARWPDFQLDTYVLRAKRLGLRVRLAETYPLEIHGALEARCNWWNQVHAFLKASVRILELHAGNGGGDSVGDDGAGVAARPVVAVFLDLDLPCEVGIAPVQIQALIQAVLDNVGTFRGTARLDALRIAPGWAG